MRFQIIDKLPEKPKITGGSILAEARVANGIVNHLDVLSATAYVEEKDLSALRDVTGIDRRYDVIDIPHNVIPLDWFGLYKSQSKDKEFYTEASTGHPAKMSLDLTRRIFSELVSIGWLAWGDVVVDPFCGRGTTPIEWCAMHESNRAITMELEYPFYRMEWDNINHFQETQKRTPLWYPLIGDSRRFHEVMEGNYSTCRETIDRYVEKKYAEAIEDKIAEVFATVAKAHWDATVTEEENSIYSFEEHQKSDSYCEAFIEWRGEHEESIRAAFDPISAFALGALGIVYPCATPEDGSTPVEKVLMCGVSSPPYGKGVVGSCSSASADRLRKLTQDPTSSLYGRDPNGAWFKAMVEGYGKSDGNIDLLPDGKAYDELAAVSSPPYSGNIKSDYRVHNRDERRLGEDFSGNGKGSFRGSEQYGQGDGQIGMMKDPDKDYAVGISSPPYEESLTGDDPDKRGGLFRDPKRRNDRTLTAHYQKNEGSGVPPPLDLPQGRCAGSASSDLPAAAVSSQPYEAQSGGHPIAESGPLSDERLHARHAASKINAKTGYGDNGDGQIGVQKGETYANACRDVYRSLWKAGVKRVVLVTKNPVKNQKLRRLDLLTIKIMREAGYRLEFRRRAWLWETRAQMKARGVTPPPLEKVSAKMRAAFAGREDEIPHGRISFFNIMHMQAGKRAPAQYEDVLFFTRIDE